jgi:hypothetical protein
MGVDRLKVDRKAVKALLRSPEIRAELRARAGRIAAAAGDGFEARTSTGRTRARAVVITTDDVSRRAQAEDRALSKALTAGR